jgi:hypothetical protein
MLVQTLRTKKRRYQIFALLSCHKRKSECPRSSSVFCALDPNSLFVGWCLPFRSKVGIWISFYCMYPLHCVPGGDSSSGDRRKQSSLLKIKTQIYWRVFVSTRTLVKRRKTVDDSFSFLRILKSPWTSLLNWTSFGRRRASSVSRLFSQHLLHVSLQLSINGNETCILCFSHSPLFKKVKGEPVIKREPQMFCREFYF